jgi:tetratricopeptide (TPR) repeat protein
MREGVVAARGLAVGVGMRLDLSHYLPKFAINVPIRSPNRWPRRTTLAWITVVSLAGLAAIVALLPMLISARYRAAGEAALASDAARAAIAFRQALRWSPNSPEIHRALAHSYLQLNQPQEAIDMLEQAYRLRPESLLIGQELAQAYEAGGQIERADGMWAALGLTPEHSFVIGDGLFDQHRYLEAHTWYERAVRRAASLSFDRLFKDAITATLAGAAYASQRLRSVQEHDPSFLVYELDNQLSIPGSDLRWMTSVPSRGSSYGTPLSYGTNPNNRATNTTGMLWWSGNAVAVVSVKDDGFYRISMLARHSKPAPVAMAMGIDNQQLWPVTLTRGDDSWETVTVTAHLSGGLHTMDIWFLNNDVVDKLDRDAAIQWISLEKERP